MSPPLDEFARIARFFAPLAAGFPGALNLVDDAALIACPAGRELVVTTDALVAGVHFLPDDPPETLGRKVLGVNLSDLAAKGAEPLAYTLVTALTRAEGEAWLEGFAAGLAAMQAEHGIQLAGGDSVSTPGPVMLSVTAFGTVPAGAMIGRGGARPGDGIYVTGTLGDAALGLKAIRGGITDAGGFLAGRYRCPQPRTAVGPALRGIASAMIDVSDGLVADLGHLCAVSGVGAEVEAGLLPLSAAARPHAGDLAAVLSGGDDYELLFTASDRQPPPAAIAGIPITRIGRIGGGAGVRVLDSARGLIAVPRGGWRHF
ncbi:MAG: thiamine-phosphate kinase [Thalassobaculales bacterium]